MSPGHDQSGGSGSRSQGVRRAESGKDVHIVMSVGKGLIYISIM
jgi:hypothetical protein